MTETTEITKPTETSLRVERTFDAPTEDVFDAWTNPEVLRRWWRPNPGWVTPVAEVDLRVGGRYRISMEDPETGTKHTAGGEYSEVSRPQRLVYSWQWEQDDGQPDHVSTVTVSFHADGERTNVVLEHSGLVSSESRDSHTHGWAGILEMLQVHLFENAAQTS
ncbi:MAG TPA: SRPBCC domain-containing protein [Solirubrobacteraceae bacterium]|jgi:uncharacterized protein YndB with AHSA1/START domain|nr:SRPBCC domain-containing protein [Solirubrobacteraceae bacterium]